MPCTDKLAIQWGPRLLSVLRIATALLFLEHGTQKMFGFPLRASGAGPEVFSLLWFAGTLEITGGLLMLGGLFTRPAAFVLSGMMAFAYFIAHGSRGFFPALNGGDAAILYCFIFLLMSVAGGGEWSLDRLLAGRTSFFGRQPQPA